MGTIWVILSFLAFVPCTSQATAHDLSRNDVHAPINTRLIRYLVATLESSGSQTRGVPEAILSECSDGALSPPTRILVNDVRVEADKQYARPVLGSNCRVSFERVKSSGIHLSANAVFRDAFARGGTWSAQSTNMDFLTDAGDEIRVPATILPALGGVTAFERMKIVAMPFRDIRYALFVVVGASVTRASAEAYFRSDDFKRGAGYHGDVSVWLPNLRVSQTNKWCVKGCDHVDVTQRIALSLSSSGAGDAPELPEYLPENGAPSLGVYKPFSSRVESPVTIKADHPFYVALVSIQTHVVLMDAFIEQPAS